MAYYMLLVFVSPDEKDIESTVERLLEPFSRWLEVPSYKEYLEDYEVQREAIRYDVLSNQLEIIASKMREEDDDEEEGIGIDEKGLYRLTTRNPQGRWDAWHIGGVWDGYIQLKRRKKWPTDDVGPEHEQLKYNTCIVSQIPKFFLPYEVITPDGVWHSWGEWEKPRRSSLDQMIELNELAERYANYIAVCLACHF